jgi:hypothetical protein
VVSPYSSPAIQGDNVSKKDPFRNAYYRIYREDFGGSFTVDILQCEDMDPPKRKSSNVSTLCTINCTLDIPFSSLPDFINPSGEKFKKMSYVVEMVPSGATIEFVVYIDGRRQGTQNASIRFE